MKKRVNIAIFASGGGSNAEAVIKHFEDNDSTVVKLVVTNRSDAGVIDRAQKYGIETYVHSSDDAKSGDILERLRAEKIDFIVLAGYLKKIGDDLIHAYPTKIVNIHPALLPKFGGKGMYGMHVHRAVVAAGEKESGPTIHFVNEHYDEGTIIEQHRCEVLETDTPEDVQKKVLELEHKYFAPCIQKLIDNGI